MYPYPLLAAGKAFTRPLWCGVVRCFAMALNRALWIAGVLLGCSALYGEIIETRSFQEITRHVTPNTLVVLDIDDTLLVPVQTLGTDAWFRSRLAYHLQTKSDQGAALDRTLAEWEAIRHITEVKMVEEGTDRIIDEMQRKQIRVMGLTTQAFDLANRSEVQLKSLGIDLAKTPPATQDLYFVAEGKGVLYRRGILFTSGTGKGEALLRILEHAALRPTHVLFINDKRAHLQEVEQVLGTEGIAYTGLRYTYSDERVDRFCQEIADIQWVYSTFDHLVSDEEALSLLESMQAHALP